ncbi:winged helix-turn-helix transcriptional regulator [Haladaptatus salinisoli]|uniref:winged helix-turn-helix transcriptional regulator n=1 Tax=Haladaptatus salinisoli TaxID=2884876 RepID=UPI001D0ADF6E|nr:helix-turn-helix domain-containing protein [Haladaptatus salinisoli]
MHRHSQRVVAAFFVFLVVATVPLAFVHPASANAPARQATPVDGASTEPRTIDVPDDARMRLSYPGSLVESLEYAEMDASSSSTGVRSYSRYDGSNPLDNVTRSAVHDAIIDDPGLSLSALSDRTAIPRSTVRYHVRILEEERLVETARVRGKRRAYPADDDDPELAASLSDDSTAALLETVARDGPASVSELAVALDRTPGTVSYHLERLADDGLVERERAGNAVVTTLPDRVRDAIDAD